MKKMKNFFHKIKFFHPSYGNEDLLKDFRQDFMIKQKFVYGPMYHLKRLCHDTMDQRKNGIEKINSIYGIVSKRDGDVNQLIVEARKIIIHEAESDVFKYFGKKN